jgi:mRNA interferase MazF
MSGNPGRGDVCWADLGEPKGSRPAKRRPVLVIQADPYNASKLNTTLVAVITSNTALAMLPGNVFLPAVASGLPKDSVLNVTALTTIDKADLDPPVGQLPSSLMTEIDRGLRRVLGLQPATVALLKLNWYSATVRRHIRAPTCQGETRFDGCGRASSPATESRPRGHDPDLGSVSWPAGRRHALVRDD